ncbi:MAG: type II toxin-antitoxin system RelE/ParE family toxin [Bacteroidales bacterium]|nr:type II toxin-antitoxin system RelE/ParE family toxin [Bacteroidales bacterium]
MSYKTPLQVNFLKEAKKFLMSLPEMTRKKVVDDINSVLDGMGTFEMFKKLDRNIWEFRTNFQGMAYRLFAFYDKEEGALIVATHGIIKKTQKTPRKEIERANRIRTMYFAQKR